MWEGLQANPDGAHPMKRRWPAASPVYWSSIYWPSRGPTVFPVDGPMPGYVPARDPSPSSSPPRTTGPVHLMNPGPIFVGAPALSQPDILEGTLRRDPQAAPQCQCFQRRTSGSIAQCKIADPVFLPPQKEPPHLHLPLRCERLGNPAETGYTWAIGRYTR